MRPEEMNKLTVWMVGVFPQWKPDKGVAAVWAGELPDVQAGAAITAVRRLMTRNPKPFPPSVFEIIQELNGGPGKLGGRRSWQKILGLVRQYGGAGFPDQMLEQCERDAVALIGGIKAVANSAEGDPFIERRFLEAFEGVKEESDVLRIGSAGQVRALSDGEGLCGADQHGEEGVGLARRDGGA